MPSLLLENVGAGHFRPNDKSPPGEMGESGEEIGMHNLNRVTHLGAEHKRIHKTSDLEEMLLLTEIQDLCNDAGRIINSEVINMYRIMRHLGELGDAANDNWAEEGGKRQLGEIRTSRRKPMPPRPCIVEQKPGGLSSETTKNNDAGVD